jgi:hypothetical protein
MLSIPPLLLEEDLEEEEAFGYLNQVGKVFETAPSPANSGSVEVIRTGALPRIGAHWRGSSLPPSVSPHPTRIVKWLVLHPD